MGNPGGSLGGDWEGEEDGDAERRPLELRRLLLSGEVLALRSGEGSGWEVEAGRAAFPLRMSMTLRLRATISGVSLWQFLRLLSAPLRTSVRTSGRSPRPDAECSAELPEYICAFTLAPCCSSSCTMLRLLFSTAWMSGERPLLMSTASMSAPRSSKSCTVSWHSVFTATCRAVSPS